MRTYHVLMIGLALVFTTGCGSSKKAPPAAANTKAAANAGAQAQPGAVLPGSGSVLETMNAGGYTYVNVEIGGTNLWAAGHSLWATRTLEQDLKNAVGT